MEDMNISSENSSPEITFKEMTDNRLCFTRRSSQLIKRSLDFITAAFLLLFFAPAIIVLWWIISRDGGKAIYCQQRIGQHGVPFCCFNFRTMVLDADERLSLLLATSERAKSSWEDNLRLEQDPRLTTTGKFLRTTSLHKLPRLLNVLRGEMSLVGTRAVTATELKRYNENFSYYLAAKPGITGLNHLSSDQNHNYDVRAHLDAIYINQWSLGKDVYILYQSVKKLVTEH